MIRIINGKKYDTATAERIGHYSYGNSCDFHHFCEELYRKKTGEFFLYGEGGPMSEYSVQTDTNSWSGSEIILPYSDDDAKAWVENYCDAEKYIEVFGDVEE